MQLQAEPPQSEKLLSDKLMQRLMDEAERLGRYAPTRLGTLRRLKTACDDILSGTAERMAESEGLAHNDYRGPVKLNPAIIERYVNLRATMNRADCSEWTGPKASILRRDYGLRAYVDARRVEAFGTRNRRPKGNRATRVEDAINKLTLEDRNVVRDEIEVGREARKELNLLKETVKSLRPIEYEELVSLGQKKGMRLRSAAPPPNRNCVCYGA